MSASVFGNKVPRQTSSAPTDTGAGVFALASFSKGAITLSACFAGPVVPNIVHSCFTSGLMSGYFSFSSAVGFHGSPVGGPNAAQLLSCLASVVVVNLASSEVEAAMAGDAKDS